MKGLFFTFVIVILVSFMSDIAFGQVVTSCSQCTTSCVPLQDGENTGQCCGIRSTNNTTNGTAYCDVFCVAPGRKCCGCNLMSANYVCLSCPSSELCKSDGTGSIKYYCASGIERLVPTIAIIVFLVFGLFI